MTIDSIPANALVVVADGGKAVLFRNTGKPGAVTLQEERRMTPNTAEAQGPSGARPTGQTVKQTQEASFVNVVAHALHDLHNQGGFTSLILVADPQTLGELRSAIHKSVEAAVVGSLAKDLTNHSTQDIAKALSH